MLTAAGSGYSRWGDSRSRAGARTRRATTGAATSSCATSQSGAVWSAGYQPSGTRAGQLRGHVRRGSRRIRAPRRHAHDHARSRRLAGGRRRSPAGVDRQYRRRGRARSRSPPTPRSCWRRTPPTWPIRPSPSCSWRPNICRAAGAILATRRRRSPDEPESGPRISRWSRARRRRARDRDRPRALPRPRATTCAAPVAVIDGRRAVRHRRAGARSGLRAAPARARCRPAARRAIAFWTLVASSREACSTSSTSIRTPPPSSAPRRLPGPRRRCSFATSTSTPSEASLFQRLAGHVLYADPALRSSSDTIRRGAGAASRRCGRRASPATCRSCWCASTRSRISGSCAQCCAPTNIGA